MGLTPRPLCEVAPPVLHSHAGLSTLPTSILASWLGPSGIGSLASTQSDNRLVVIFLRGAMDGASLLVPYGDDEYHNHRRTIGLGTPKTGLIDLDGFFGLHPAATSLKRWYQTGKLAGIHAIGSMDQTRSHFEAMATMERGAAGEAQQLSSGWLARALYATQAPKPSPLRAVAFGSLLPDTLRGAPSPSVIRTINDVKLGGSKALREILKQLYEAGDTVAHASGIAALAVLDAMDKVNPDAYVPVAGANYPKSPTGESLRQAALLLKANVGTSSIFIDSTGWDSHVTQGTSTGYLAGLFTDLADAISAFATDIGNGLEKTTIVVMTEFGRRIPENSALGTDHGRAGAWLVMGNGVSGGRVHATWPGLKTEQLDGPGDLRVTLDYRNVLLEASQLIFGQAVTSGALFPGLQYKPSGVFPKASDQA